MNLSDSRKKRLFNNLSVRKKKIWIVDETLDLTIFFITKNIIFIIEESSKHSYFVI